MEVNARNVSIQYFFLLRKENETGKKYDVCVRCYVLLLLLLLYHHHTPYYYKKNYDSQLFQSLFKITIKEENLTVDPGNNNQQQQTTEGEQKIAKLRLLVSSFHLSLVLLFFKIETA